MDANCIALAFDIFLVNQNAKRSTVNKQLYDVTNIIVQLLLYSIRFARPSLTL